MSNEFGGNFYIDLAEGGMAPTGRLNIIRRVPTDLKTIRQNNSVGGLFFTREVTTTAVPDSSDEKSECETTVSSFHIFIVK